MPDAFITVQLEGTAEDGGDVRLVDFIEELDAIKGALRQTQRVVLQRDESVIEYSVSNLTHSSPARVTIKISAKDPAFKDSPRRIQRRFTSSLALVRRSHRYAERLDVKTLGTFKALSSPVRKHVAMVTVIDEKRAVKIDQQFDRSLNRLLICEEQERDEIVGRVERVDIHNKNQFDIYPAVGPDRVRCSAPNALLEQVIAAIGKSVSVEGWALYRKDAPFPYAMRVERIHPLRPNQELSTMESLHGASPDATAGLSAEEFVREFRNAYW